MSKHQQRQKQKQQQHQYQQQQQQQQYYELASEDEEYDPLANLVSLQLHKPAKWNLELSTSRSCSNIALPRILLYDQKGVLLLDANGHDEQTYRLPTTPSNGCKRTPREFDDLTATSRLTPTISPLRKQLSGRSIDFYSHELADSQIRRSSSLGGGEDQEHRQSQQRLQKLVDFSPLTTSTLTTNDNSSSTGTQEKRRYRRSHSSGHRSILERFSMSRGRLSSPEYVQEETLERAPRYFLRSSKAGTLVIKDESFSHVHQRRRRHKDSSNENMLIQKDRSPIESVPVVSSRRRIQHQKQRGRESLLSTSEDEVQAEITRYSGKKKN